MDDTPEQAEQWRIVADNYIPERYGVNNSTMWASGGMYRPDTRTEAEKAADARRWRREATVRRWKWRLRGLLPRGWKQIDCCDDY